MKEGILVLIAAISATCWCFFEGKNIKAASFYMGLSFGIAITLIIMRLV